MRLGAGGRRPVAGLALVWVFAASCVGAGIEQFVPDRPQPAEISTPEGEPLCRRPVPKKGEPGEGSTPVPSGIREVARGVEDVRGLEFRSPLRAGPVSRQKLRRIILRSIQDDLPQEETERQQRAWETIGVIPKDTDLVAAVRELAASQVIGLYDTSTHELFFLGDDTSSPLERLVLSHELTHALDDQWFDLSRADLLGSTCQEDRLDAFIALAEGDAQAMSQAWAARNFTGQDFLDLAEDAGALAPPPSGVPPFIRSMLEFPYSNGQAFVSALLERGGQESLDDAFRNPPASTEQVLHPSKYPREEPVAVDPPHLASTLGSDWDEIDALDVGEAWVLMMLELRLGPDRSERAAAGWAGGRYRAFGSGTEVAVVLDTAWDSEVDAEDFAEAVGDWAEGQSASVLEDGVRVRVFFASDRIALDAVERAAG